MSDNTTIISQVEAIAEALVMLDPRDLPSLARFCKSLAQLADDLETDGTDASGDASAAARQASKEVESIILNECDSAKVALERVAETVSALQSTLCYGRDASLNQASNNSTLPDSEDETPRKHQAEEAASAVLNEESESPSESGISFLELPHSVPSGMDPDLFHAFLEQQSSVLPEMDALLLAVEEGENADDLAALRRLLHTMKGEAGVVGFEIIEKLCHKIEDYLDAFQSDVGGDLLFEVKDWLSNAVEMYASGRAPAMPTELIGKLERAVRERLNKAVPESETQPAVAEIAETESMPAATTLVEEPAQELPTASRAELEPVILNDLDLARDFVNEAQEHFDIADENLLVLENEPDNHDAIDAVFRSFHTIKGVSGFLDLTPIGNLAHIAETLLDDVRKGRKTFTGSAVDVTFSALDMLKELMGILGDALSTNEAFVAPDRLVPLIDNLRAVLAGEEIAPLASPSPKAIDVKVTGSEEAVAPSAPVAAPEAVKAKPGKTPRGQGMIKQVMKVEAEKVDLLLDTIGELVIAESIVAQDPEILNLNSQRVQKNLGHLSKIARQLQDMGMAMRLVPIEATFRKMARLVRDLAKKSGKIVNFEMEGQDTEIDKGMVEKLGDPLVHMIRNSVDHGIEADPAARAEGGKSPTGLVRLRAYHKGGNIQIEVSDDGHGLDRKKIAAKAIEKGVIDTDEGMSDSEVFQLIFAAGFSTADKVTEISGRGVGMDVVRRNIDSLRGKVMIDSTLGKGTTFTVVLPLTMAIIDGMQVRVGGETYIIPTLSIIESFRPEPGMITTIAGKGAMISFRGKMLPMFRLATLFDVPNAGESALTGTVVAIEDSGRQAAIMVDELLGQQQTVIKSIGDAMGVVDGVSGASIMADGRPGLILDVGGIVRLATAA